MGPEGPLQGIIHILAAINFDGFIPTKIPQKYVVTTLLVDKLRQNRRHTFQLSQISLNTCLAVGDFSLRRVGINFRFETGVVEFAQFV